MPSVPHGDKSCLLHHCISVSHKTYHGDLPGGQEANIPRSQCKWPGFNHWSGNWTLHATTKTQCSQINKLIIIFLKNCHDCFNFAAQLFFFTNNFLLR